MEINVDQVLSEGLPFNYQVGERIAEHKSDIPEIAIMQADSLQIIYLQTQYSDGKAQLHVWSVPDQYTTPTGSVENYTISDLHKKLRQLPEPVKKALFEKIRLVAVENFPDKTIPLFMEEAERLLLEKGKSFYKKSIIVNNHTWTVEHSSVTDAALAVNHDLGQTISLEVLGTEKKTNKDSHTYNEATSVAIEQIRPSHRFMQAEEFKDRVPYKVRELMALAVPVRLSHDLNRNLIAPSASEVDAALSEISVEEALAGLEKTVTQWERDEKKQQGGRIKKWVAKHRDGKSSGNEPGV